MQHDPTEPRHACLAAQALATAGPKAPSRTEWLRHLRKALAGQEKEGDRTNIRLAALGPLHDRMQAGVDDEVLRVHTSAQFSSAYMYTV